MKNYEELVLNYVMSNNGIMEFDKPLFDMIKKIKGVWFNEQFDIEQDDPNSLLWNAYATRIQNASGTKHYCTWIHNDDFNMVGILAFYDSDNNEIKMKYFEDWKKLRKKIKNYGKKNN